MVGIIVVRGTVAGGCAGPPIRTTTAPHLSRSVRQRAGRRRHAWHGDVGHLPESLRPANITVESGHPLDDRPASSAIRCISARDHGLGMPLALGSYWGLLLIILT